MVVSILANFIIGLLCDCTIPIIQPSYKSSACLIYMTYRVETGEPTDRAAIEDRACIPGLRRTG